MSVRGRLSSRAWFVTFVSAVSVLVVGLAVAGWFVWANDSSTVVATNPAAPMFDAASLEDLAERLNDDPPYDGNIDVDHEDELPTEIRSLMATYGIDAQGAVAQLNAQGAAGITGTWLQEILGDDPRIGGMRTDHGRGGHLVVHTSDAELGRQIVAATAELVPVFVQVTSVSEQELEAIAQQAWEVLDLVDSESRQGSGVPYYSVGVELRNERVVIEQSSLAPDELRRKAETLAQNPLVVIEDLGPIILDRGGDE